MREGFIGVKAEIGGFGWIGAGGFDVLCRELTIYLRVE